MKADYVAIYNTDCIYPHDGTASVSIILTENIGFEAALFVIGDISYSVSLNLDDPIEDVEIPDKDWKIIQKYIDKLGGYNTILEKSQEFYNMYMTPEEREEYHKNDIIKSINKRKIIE